MAKYHLVASYYDMYEKDPNLKYKGEVEVSLPGVDLSTLQAIDCFTASHTHLEIMNILNKNGIKGKNQLAVKFQKNSTSKPEYYRVIENNKEFVDCTEIKDRDAQKVCYQMFGETIRALSVPLGCSLFIRERNIFERLLDESNFQELKKRVPFTNSMLYRMIEEYFKAPHDSESDKNLVRKNLVIEFSKYKTFRGWIVVKENSLYYERKGNLSVNKNSNVIVPKKNINVKTSEEYADEYEKRFNKNNQNRGITYISNQTYQYNTSRLDSEKEEFLSDEEHSSLHGEDSVSLVRNKKNLKKKKILKTSRSRGDY